MTKDLCRECNEKMCERCTVELATMVLEFNGDYLCRDCYEEVNIQLYDKFGGISRKK